MLQPDLCFVTPEGDHYITYMCEFVGKIHRYQVLMLRNDQDTVQTAYYCRTLAEVLEYKLHFCGEIGLQ